MKGYQKLLCSSAAVMVLMTAGPALAGPQGGVVSAGNATIQTINKKTNIHQSSNKAIIDWRSFDIAPDEHTQFYQPSKTSVTLNRINDVKPSQIDGRISANGHVVLVNPNGVVFGAGSQVDVGALTATSADIDNDAFMNGRMDFDKAGNLDAKIINEGTITAKEAGLVSLVAPHVENHGVIEAKLGKIQLAAADTFTLDLAGDGLINIAVTEDEAKKLVRNSGRITAEGGTIALTAGRARTLVDSLVDNSGVIEAHSMTNVGGKIVLSAHQGTTHVSGTIDASGKLGGGQVLIGGGKQGQDATIAHNAKTVIEESAVIKANATDIGDGGQVILWADDQTVFAGSIEAKGGQNGGHGGFVETSGKLRLNVRETAQVDAASLVDGYLYGSWLLDPSNVFLTNGGANSVPGGGGTVNPSSDDFYVDIGTLETALNGNNNVIITTANGGGTQDGNITVQDAISWTGASSLTLDADNDIYVNNTIDSTNAAGDLILNAGGDGAGNIDITAPITLGGSFDATATGGTITVNKEITAVGINFNNYVDFDDADNDLDIDAGTGTISISSEGGIVTRNTDFLADDFVIDGNITGPGYRRLDFFLNNAGRTFGLGDGASGDVVLSDAELARMDNAQYAFYSNGDMDIHNTVGPDALSVFFYTPNGNALTIDQAGIDFGNANVFFYTDDFTFEGTSANGDIRSTGNLNLGPRNSNITVGVGDGTTGTRFFSNDTISRFVNFDTITFAGLGGANMEVATNTWDSNIVFGSNGGTLTILGDQNLQGNNLTLATSNDLNLLGTIESAGGDLIISANYDGSFSLGNDAGNVPGQLYMSDSSLGNIAEGWSSITFQRQGTLGNINFDTAAASFTFLDPVIFDAREDLTINSNLLGADDATFTLNSFAGDTFINANIDTSGGLGGNFIDFTTTNNITTDGNLITNNGDISFDGALTTSSINGYSFDAGTSNINFNDSVFFSNDINLFADNYTVGNMMSGTTFADIRFGLTTAGRTMGVGTGATGDFVFSDTELGFMDNAKFHFVSNGDLDVHSTTGSSTNSVLYGSAAGSTLNVDQAGLNLGAIDVIFETDNFNFEGTTANGDISGTGNLWFRTVSSGITTGIGDGTVGARFFSDDDLSRFIGFDTWQFAGGSDYDIASRNWMQHLTLGGQAMNFQGNHDFNGNDLYIANRDNIFFNGSMQSLGGDLIIESSFNRTTQIGDDAITVALDGAKLRDSDIANIADGWNSILFTHSGPNGEVIIDAGGASLTFSDAVTFNATDGITLNSDLIGTDNASFTFTGGTDLVDINADIDTSGGVGGNFIDFNTVDAIELDADLTTNNGDIDFGAAVNVTTAAARTIDAQTGTISFADTFFGSAFGTTFVADDYAFTGDVSTLGNGNLSFGLVSSGRTFGLGTGATGDVVFNDATLALLKAGPGPQSALTFRTTDGDMDVRTISGAAETDAKAVYFNAGTGTISIDAIGAPTETRNVFFTADNFIINNLIDGIGTLQFRNATRFRSMGIGDGTIGDNFISTAMLDNIGSDWSKISFFSADGELELADYAWNSDLQFDSGLYEFDIIEALDFGANNVTLGSRNYINIDYTISGTGNLEFFEVGNSAESIMLGDDAIAAWAAPTTMKISDNSLSNIADGWNSILFRAGGNVGSQLNIDTALASFEFKDDVTFRNSRDLSLNSDIGVALGSDASITFDGNGIVANTFNLNGNIDLSNGDGTGTINFMDIDTLNYAGSIITNGTDIVIDNTINNFNLIGNTTFNAGASLIDIGPTGIAGGAFDLALIADDVDLAGTLVTTGDVTLRAATAGTNMLLGTVTAPSGVFHMTDAELALLNANKLILGNDATPSGTVTLNSVDVSANTTDLEVYGNNIVSNLLTANNSVFMQANNNIEVRRPLNVSGAGNSVVMVANSFDNTHGVGAINPGTGRYLIYLDNTANVNKGGLTGGNLYNRTYAGDPPASIAMGFGDSFIYANRPTLTFKANSFVQTNPNVPINYSYTVTGFVPGDPLGGVVSGTPTFNKIFTDTNSGIIKISQGSLTSPLGYFFNFINGAFSVNGKEQLPPSVEYQMRTPVMVADASTNSESEMEQQQIMPQAQRILSDSAERDAAVRLTEAKQLKITKPVVDFYNLCSYNERLCSQ